MVRPNEPQVGSRAAELEAELAEARALLAQAAHQRTILTPDVENWFYGSIS